MKSKQVKTNWKLFTYFSGLWYETDGKPSFSRFITAIFVISAIIWISYFVFNKGTIPDLAGLSLLSGTILGLTYGVNKVSQSFGTATPPNP